MDKKEKNSELFFTVFTPIYNRKHTIHRVWDSLNAQTVKTFEWLIIDDGSEDDVLPLLNSYKEQADFPVRIFSQKNSGKHMAFNKAIAEAQGTLLIPADSDDSFVPETIEFFKENWLASGTDSLSGISVLCVDEQNNIIGTKFPFEDVSTHHDIVFKHKVKGEKWGCLRVDVLRQFEFPSIEGAKFFPESYLWFQIGFNYQTLYLNKPLRVYYQDAGNQLMKTGKQSLENLRVGYHYTIWWINYVLPRARKYISFKEVLTRFVSIWKTSFSLKFSSRSTLRKIRSTNHKVLAMITFVPSFILFKLFGYKM